MILCGYLGIVFWEFLLLVLTNKALPRILPHELCRKLLHIGTLVSLPIAVYFFGKGSVHFVILCLAFSAGTAWMHFPQKSLPVNDREKSYPGIFYYALSLLLTALLSFLLPRFADGFTLAFVALTIGDGCASLIGSLIKSPKIRGNKTLIGFFACFVGTTIAFFLLSLRLLPNLSVGVIIALSLLTAIIELSDYGLDNLLIPLFVFGAFVLFQIWNGTTIALFLAEAVFAIAFFSRFIEYRGALLAASVGTMFFATGGIVHFLYLIGCYTLMLTVALIRKLKKNDISDVVKKTKGKDITEIFVNGAPALLALLMFVITGWEPLKTVSLVSISEGFVDSFASDIGTLSQKTPYDPFHRRRVARGVSGGMTVLGSTAMTVGAFLFATVISLIVRAEFSPPFVFASTGVLLAGALADSLLGSLVQVKYRCVVCGKMTEREEHCGTTTEKVGGFTAMNNDTVNLSSGFVSFGLAFLLYFI